MHGAMLVRTQQRAERGEGGTLTLSRTPSGLVSNRKWYTSPLSTPTLGGSTSLLLVPEGGPGGNARCWCWFQGAERRHAASTFLRGGGHGIRGVT